MGKANCGGLILDNTVLVVVNNIITTVDSTPTTAVKANCGGVQFDATLFKNVDGVITDINADENAVLGFVVPQQGCGGVVLDSNYFELNDNDEVTFEVPAPPVQKYKLSRTVEGGAIKVYRDSETVDDGNEALIAGDIISFIGTPTSETMTLDTFTINGEDADIDTPLTVTEDVAINAIFV